MFALTGDLGHNLRYNYSPKGASAPAGSIGEKPPFDVPLREGNVSRFEDANGAYSNISEALEAGRAVTLSTRSKDVNDGLMEHHAYVVTGVEQRAKKDGTSEVWITLQNPYAHNDNNPAERNDTSKPSITVSLNKMLDNEVFGEINMSPPPRLQTQQQSTPPPSPEQPTPTQAVPAPPAPAQPAFPPPNTNDITQDTHAGNLRYRQALSGIENSPNIPPGTFTGERLQQSAANVAYTSLAAEERPGIGGRNEALSRIDFVVFDKTRTALIAGEGELGNPTAKLARLPGEQDNANTLTATSERTHTLLQDPHKMALANPALAPQLAQTDIEPDRGGPRR
jgi:hypothetical protein